MSAPSIDFPGLQLSVQECAVLESLVASFRSAWREQGSPRIEDYLPDRPCLRLAVLIELIKADLDQRRQQGEPVTLTSYVERYPELVPLIQSLETAPPDSPVSRLELPQTISYHRPDGRLLGAEEGLTSVEPETSPADSQFRRAAPQSSPLAPVLPQDASHSPAGNAVL